MARIRVIFSLPQHVDRYGFSVPVPVSWPTEPLAYVTWYSRFKRSPDDVTGMYRVDADNFSGSIISLASIRQTCMLVPSKHAWEESWTSENILDECKSFFVNHLQSKYSYQTIY